MSTYLLLRDNKESGPYSFEELRNKGLKAYDLVWIEGKSAAWRYPSEVEELMAFAPAVEEQPFDRFFKKTPQQHAAHAQNNNDSVIANDSVVAEQPRSIPEKEISFSSAINGSVLSNEPSSVPGKRIIYVTLPSDRNAVGMRIPSLREPARTPSSAPAPERLSPIEKEPLRTESAMVFNKTAAPAEEKFSQGSDDLWRSSVEITPRQNNLAVKNILQPVAAIVCILALLAAGVFIGLSIKSKNDSFGFAPQAAVKEAISTAPLPTAPQQDRSLSQTAPAPVVQQTQQVQQTGASQTGPSQTGATTVNADPSASLVSASVPPVQPQKKKAERNKDRANQKNSAAPLSLKDSASMNLPAIHREAIHRTDETGLDKDAIRSSISNLVAVGAGKYSVGTFGGISDFQLTVSNHSPYPLDLVVVEVQYIQANKKVFKTENIYFRGLAPGSALMQEAPKSARGVKIQYKVTLINSKELGLSYSGL